MQKKSIIMEVLLSVIFIIDHQLIALSNPIDATVILTIQMCGDDFDVVGDFDSFSNVVIFPTS